MRAISVVAVLAVGLGGCVGGGGAKEKPMTAAEKRAELDRWVSRADAACRKSNEAIAGRGWPRNLIQLDRLAVRAVDDVREASRAVQGLVPPKGSEERVKPFVASLRALDGLLGKVTDTTDEYRPKKLNELAPDLRSGLVEVERTSKELGLRECAANDEHTWVPDAMRAPVYAQQLADLNRNVTKRMKAIAKPVSSPADAARNLDRLSDLVSKAARSLARLKPPQWADREAGRYVSSLRNFTGLLDEGSLMFERGPVTYEQFTAYRRRLDRAGRADAKRWRRLYRAVGAAPTLRGGRRGGEKQEPGGEESQPA
jgi:hypothetical protein